jgi:hypothetical protein
MGATGGGRVPAGAFDAVTAVEWASLRPEQPHCIGPAAKLEAGYAKVLGATK